MNYAAWSRVMPTIGAAILFVASLAIVLLSAMAFPVVESRRRVGLEWTARG